MRIATAVLGVCLAAACLTGCVERQMTLVTDPEGAKAYYNGKYVGETPVTFSFTYYQDPWLEFQKDGYTTLKTIGEVKTPLCERFPLDFFAETSPFTFHNSQTLTFTLAPMREVDLDALVERSKELRESIGVSR